MKLFQITMYMLLGIIFFFSHSYHTLAHNFYNNQNSIFFTLIKQFESEDKLASDDLSNNRTLAIQHSENADHLLNQLASLNNQVSNDSNFVNRYNGLFTTLNTTTKALVVANLADQSLTHYGIAQGLDPQLASGLLNMTMIMNTQMNNAPMMNMTGNISSEKADMMSKMPKTPQSSNRPNDSIINQADYETSIMLANTIKMIFSDNLQNASLQKSNGLMQLPISLKHESVKKLGQGIDNLISSLAENRSLPQVYSIVHGQIHPELFLAFDLKLKSE